jgi:hypothetical protein
VAETAKLGVDGVQGEGQFGLVSATALKTFMETTSSLYGEIELMRFT